MRCRLSVDCAAARGPALSTPCYLESPSPDARLRRWAQTRVSVPHWPSVLAKRVESCGTECGTDTLVCARGRSRRRCGLAACRRFHSSCEKCTLESYPGSASRVRQACGVEHALLREAIIERSGNRECSAVTVVESRDERAAEEVRAAAEGAAGGVAFSIGAACAGGDRERLAAHGREQLFADQAHRSFFAVDRDRARLVGSRGNGAERDRGDDSAGGAEVDGSEVVGGDGPRPVLERTLSDDGSQRRLHRLDLHAEEAERVDEVRTDGAPDTAAVICIAPPVPLPRSVPSAWTCVPHLGVTNATEVVHPFARGAERGEKAKLVIDERELTGMFLRGGDELRCFVKIGRASCRERV